MEDRSACRAARSSVGRGSRGIDGPGYADQNVTKRNWCTVTNDCLVLAADHGDDTDAPGFLVAIAVNHPLRELLLARPPLKRRMIGQAGIQPRRLPRRVTVVALLDVAGPAAMLVGTLPASVTLRRLDLKMSPCLRCGRVFENASPTTDGRQRRFETASVISGLGDLALDRMGLGISSPSLTRRMRYDRVRAAIPARVSRFVPNVHVRKAAIATAGFDIERGDFHAPISRISMP